MFTAGCAVEPLAIFDPMPTRTHRNLARSQGQARPYREGLNTDTLQTEHMSLFGPMCAEPDRPHVNRGAHGRGFHHKSQEHGKVVLIDNPHVHGQRGQSPNAGPQTLHNSSPKS